MIKPLIHSVFLVSFFITVTIGSNNEHQLIGISYPIKTEKLTFEKDIKPIMNSYCGGIFCHHGMPSVWTKYKVVKLALENGSFKKEVIDNKTMPKRKKLPEEEYNTLKKWLEEGALEK